MGQTHIHSVFANGIIKKYLIFASQSDQPLPLRWSCCRYF